MCSGTEALGKYGLRTPDGTERNWFLTSGISGASLRNWKALGFLKSIMTGKSVASVVKEAASSN